MKFASVYVFDVLYSLDKIYEYYVPEELEDSVDVGSYVCVPFGNGNRKRQAVVFSVSSDCEYENPKPIHSVISENDRVSEEFLRLAEYMKDNTFCTISDALKTILPTSQMTSEKEYYYVFPDKEKDFENSKYTGKFDLIYSYIKTRGNVSVENLKKHFGADVVSSLGTLVNLGYLKKDRNFEKKKNIKTIDLYYTELSEEEIDSILSGKGNIKVKSAKQADVLRLLRDGEKYSAEEIKSRVGVGSSPVKALLENKIIKCEKTDVYKNPYSEMCETRTKDENILSEEQNAAYEKLLSLYKSHEPKGALLFGVTGSGKTRVIKSLIDAVVNEGRGVIVLVPEISLTPQTVGLFCSFYGDRVAVIHSGLSKGERYDTYRRIKNKEADIVIGTRSAVFAPLDNVGMIVIDEEQEHTYKSDTTPKYHARDIARFRCAKHSALMLLSSATPSIESFYKARQEIYTLVRLTERYSGAELPETIIADMKEEHQKANVGPFGEELNKQLEETLSRGEQAVLFINRRGYNNFLSCVSCGYVPVCPSCSVSLTYHTKGRYVENSELSLVENKISNGYLVCHYCGYRQEVPQKCSACSSEHMRFMGFGTQKIEDELSEKYKSAKILRMDTDTTVTKFSYDKILGEFKEHKADILLGTQMVTKGHDFPDVTLSGVLLADASLYLDDYRANERTFDMITQVIGRAGRAGKAGKAVVQTYNPDNETVRLAASQDYEKFYESEIKLRKAYTFPPFCNIALVSFSSAEETEVRAVAASFGKRLYELINSDFADVKTVIFGPLEAPVFKMSGKYRMRYVIKCKLNGRTKKMFSLLLDEFSGKVGKKMSVGIDINPNTI